MRVEFKMPRTKAPPCKGCEERSEECHATCRRFKQWKKKDRQMKAEIRRKQIEDSIRGGQQ